MMNTVSAIVRTLNSAKTLERCLRSLREQTLLPKVVVVDSGSTDDTLAIARADGATILEIPPAGFSYGRALNLGAQAASGAIHIALSSHCALPRKDWVAIAASHLEQETAAATTGKLHDPRGRILDTPLVVDAGMPIDDPYWSFSNHASAWRQDVWAREPFDENLLACEDTEWGDRVVDRGFSVVYDPRLLVDGGHRREAGIKALVRRHRKEVGAILTVRRSAPVPTVSSVLYRYAFDHPQQYVRWKRLVSPYRAAELAGELAGGYDYRHGRVPGPRLTHNRSTGVTEATEL